MNDEVIGKNKRNRSAAYPAIDIQEAQQHLSTLHRNLGAGPYDRLNAAKVLGYKGVTGASASRIAALVHYGMLQRVAGGGYAETELAKKILNHLDDAELAECLIVAFLSPALFASLYKDFKDKALPQKLDVILVRNYRITEQAARDVARIFRQSAERVGLLSNGFMSSRQTDTQENIELDGLTPVASLGQPYEAETVHNVSPAFTQPVPRPAPEKMLAFDTSMFTIPIAHGVEIRVPVDMTSDVARGLLVKTVDDLEKLLNEKYGTSIISGLGQHDEKAEAES